MKTYKELLDFIQKGRNKTCRTLENNTKAVYFPDADKSIQVQLHDNPILEFQEDGTIIVKDCGWWTITTKDRINRYSPFQVYGGIKNHILKVLEKEYKFTGKAKVLPDGTVEGADLIPPKTPKVKKPRSKNAPPPYKLQDFINDFVKGTLGRKTKLGHYKVQDGILIYQDIEVLAVKLPSGETLANASRLVHCRGRLSFGLSLHRNRIQSPVQVYLEQAGASLVPFTVLSAAGASGSRLVGEMMPMLKSIKIIQKAPPETVSVMEEGWINYELKKWTVERHFAGACLLEVYDLQYLFDIDRQEIQHHIFNPFIVELPKKCGSIEDAYDCLIPDAVRQARANGVEVQRQGEWFFIKCFDELPPLPEPSDEVKRGGSPEARPEQEHFDTSELQWYSNPAWDVANEIWEDYARRLRLSSPNEGRLVAGSSRPNQVEKLVVFEGKTLVHGKISHSGRQHKDLFLAGWYQALPNTAVNSWQVSGDVD